MRHRDRPSGMRDLIDAAGSLTELARGLGKPLSTVNRWRAVPAELVIKAERLTGIPRHKIRPDVYPPEEYAA